MSIINIINNPPNDHNIRIGFLGQSGYVLNRGETTVLIDPYLSNFVEHSDGLNDQKMERSFPPVVEPQSIKNIDAVFCTHAHADHMDPWTIEKIKAPFKLTEPTILSFSILILLLELIDSSLVIFFIICG